MVLFRGASATAGVSAKVAFFRPSSLGRASCEAKPVETDANDSSFAIVRWKAAKVAGSTDIKDTRPIVLVDVLRNCFLGIQFKGVVRTWVRWAAIDALQYGFMPHVGTETARLVMHMTMGYCRGCKYI